MSIKCTYGELDRLRDQPTRQGPLGKLASSEDPTIVDRFRIGKLLRAVDAELAAYGKALTELGKKYGNPVKINGLPSYQITPENMEVYAAEKTKLDGDSCELACNPLPVSAYEKVGLSALDLAALSPFIVMPDLPADAK